MDRVTISVVTSVGAFSVAALSIWCGYQLFLMGAQGDFKFEAAAGPGSVGFASVAPGLAFAFFGAFLAAWSVYRLIGKG